MKVGRVRVTLLFKTLGGSPNIVAAPPILGFNDRL